MKTYMYQSMHLIQLPVCDCFPTAPTEHRPMPILSQHWEKARWTARRNDAKNESMLYKYWNKHKTRFNQKHQAINASSINTNFHDNVAMHIMFFIPLLPVLISMWIMYDEAAQISECDWTANIRHNSSQLNSTDLITDWTTISGHPSTHELSTVFSSKLRAITMTSWVLDRHIIWVVIHEY